MQIKDHFPKIQSSPFFSSIDCTIQMEIARNRLNNLINSRTSSMQGDVVRSSLLYDYDNGLRYFFRDFFPKTEKEIKQDEQK